MSRPSVVPVTGRQRAHEVLLLAVSVLLGAVYLLRPPAPGTVNAALPQAVVLAWAVVLLVTGAAGLTGCYWRPLPESLQMERGAMLAQAGALILYVAAAGLLVGVPALVSGLLCTGWAVANLVRAAQISRDLRTLEELR